MDGSSRPFVELIESQKLIDQNKHRKIIKVKKKIEVKKNDSFVCISPNNQFSVDFDHQNDFFFL